MLIACLPSLFLAARYWSPYLPSGLGVVYLAGRFVYWRSYVRDPAKRGAGFVLSMLPTVALALLALAGILLALAGRTAFAP